MEIIIRSALVVCFLQKVTQSSVVTHPHTHTRTHTHTYTHTHTHIHTHTVSLCVPFMCRSGQLCPSCQRPQQICPSTTHVSSPLYTSLIHTPTLPLSLTHTLSLSHTHTHPPPLPHLVALLQSAVKLAGPQWRHTGGVFLSQFLHLPLFQFPSTSLSLSL